LKGLGVRENVDRKISLLNFELRESSAKEFHIYSNPNRIRILDFLDQAGSPQRVKAIVAESHEKCQPIVSQHLKALREAGIVDAKKIGNEVHYWIVDERALRLLYYLREQDMAIGPRDIAIKPEDT
jgi:DNA-binding transcriptional ArsR family regulator